MLIDGESFFDTHIKNKEEEMMRLMKRWRDDRDDGTTLFFIIEKIEELISEFSQNAANIAWFSLIIDTI